MAKVPKQQPLLPLELCAPGELLTAKEMGPECQMQNSKAFKQRHNCKMQLILVQHNVLKCMPTFYKIYLSVDFLKTASVLIRNDRKQNRIP